MSNKPLDLTKPVQTRDGRNARIICTDANTPQRQPIVALVQTHDRCSEVTMNYGTDGSFLPSGKERQHDLIQARSKYTKEVYMYKHIDSGSTFISYYAPSDNIYKDSEYTCLCSRTFEWME